ncbi:MAG: hypothetical protein HY098_04505 [Nitrospinae bacterium]|nr:hypothetical protein [Nitrospinota bacterium]
MKGRIYFLALSFFLFTGLALAPVVRAAEKVSVGNAFIEAFDKKDEAGMMNIIKARSKEVPDEVKSMVEYAMSGGAKKEEQDFLFNIAGMMAQIYGKVSGDERLLSAVQTNYKAVLDKRGGSEIPQKATEDIKKELTELGKGDWRVSNFKTEANGELLIEIDVKESSGGEGLTPKIEFDKTKKAKEIVQKHLPNAKKGKILWNSAGVGLKTIFLD